MEAEGVDLKKIQIDPKILEKLPTRYAFYYKTVPVRCDQKILTIALSSPFAIQVLDEISLLIGLKVQAVAASEQDIQEALHRHYGVGGETIEQMMGADGANLPAGSDLHFEDIQDFSSEASVAKFVNQILLEAYQARATDIHFEPLPDELIIRYRIDGILYATKSPENLRHFKDAINSRIKIMSNLNIAERRLPQDGRFKVKVGSLDLDLRVSFLPTPFGENLVIRILNPSRLYSLEELGLSEDDLRTIDGLLKKPHGIIFVTGPTGSGKTTTLYACLSRINTQERKILTIEDPVEYQLRGITQIQVNPKIGLTFAAGLRSMLRHDPDIMMVGEVRDFETAEIAIQVALTGHLVFSTLHTNDAATAATRLIDMGVEPYLIASSTECFIAQRLIRLVCPHCKEARKPTAELKEEFSFEVDDFKDITIYEFQGCEACRMTGYQGRQAIYEILVLDEELRTMIASRSAADEIRKSAIQKGMKNLRQQGWQKAKRGVTSLSEVLRVT